MRIEQISTPSLVVDETVYEDNKRLMAKLLEGKRIKLRPHFNSHK